MIDTVQRPPYERPLPRGRDAMRAPEVDRTPPTASRGGGAFYLTAGVLIALVLSAGLLFFNTGDRASFDQARQPVPSLSAPAPQQ